MFWTFFNFGGGGVVVKFNFTTVYHNVEMDFCNFVVSGGVDKFNFTTVCHKT